MSYALFNKSECAADLQAILEVMKKCSDGRKISER